MEGDGLMAQLTIINGEAMSSVRSKLNSNFTELYKGMAAAQNIQINGKVLQEGNNTPEDLGLAKTDDLTFGTF
jgi:hypothetical protein